MWMNGSAASNNSNIRGSSNGHGHGHIHRRGGTGEQPGSSTSDGPPAGVVPPPTSTRDYPNLAPWCRVVVLNPNVVVMGGGTGGGNRGRSAAAATIVELPAEVAQYGRNYLSSTPLVKPYDFELEKQVLSNYENRRREYLDGFRSSQSTDELKRTVVAKMMGVTSAHEAVCVSILESHSYDLTTSVEAYFASPSSSSS